MQSWLCLQNSFNACANPKLEDVAQVGQLSIPLPPFPPPTCSEQCSGHSSYSLLSYAFYRLQQHSSTSSICSDTVISSNNSRGVREHRNGQPMQTQVSSVTSYMLKHPSKEQLVPCNQYLCTDTLLCVPDPVDCPCPYVEDEKCVLVDPHTKRPSSYVCHRGPGGCNEIEKLASKWN